MRSAALGRAARRLDHDGVGALLGQQHRGVRGAEVGVDLEDVDSVEVMSPFDWIFVHPMA